MILHGEFLIIFNFRTKILKIYIRHMHLTNIFKRLSINIRKQLSVIGLLIVMSCFKPLKHHVISRSKVMPF